MTVTEVVSRSPAETLALGRRLAGLLRPGDVILLAGRLGSGKTLLVAGAAEGLGVETPVTSPSFVIVQRYEGFLPIVHADVYRLHSSGEFEDLELEESASDAALFVEWGSAVAGHVAADHLVVEIDVVGEAERCFRFVPVGSWESRSLEALLP